MLLWLGLGVLYIILLVTLGITTFRKAHWVMGIIGFVFPLFWLIHSDRRQSASPR